MILLSAITFILLVFLGVSIYNLFTAPVMNSTKILSDNDYLISVMIPARNEENNIGKCLENLVIQDYPNKEILVLDDHSTDKTAYIVKRYAEKHNIIRLLEGSELPEGWLGKNWACHQLSLQARGKYFLFIDADVELKANTLSAVNEEVNKSKAKMISVFSTQIIKSFGEWLVVPLMNWLLLVFLPLRLVYSSSNKSFSAANGQFMFWERNTYQNVGGHQRVKDDIVEDMEFARLCKSRGIKIKTMLGGNLIFCRMYENLADAFKGFSKNFFRGFNIHPLFFLLMIIFFIALFLMPFFLIPVNTLFLIPVIVILLIRGTISLLSKQNILLNILLHPLQMILMFLIGINSIIIARFKKTEWKGRRIE